MKQTTYVELLAEHAKKQVLYSTPRTNPARKKLAEVKYNEVKDIIADFKFDPKKIAYDDTNKVVITPHGGPCVDYIDMDKWPTMFDIYVDIYEYYFTKSDTYSEKELVEYFRRKECHDHRILWMTYATNSAELFTKHKKFVADTKSILELDPDHPVYERDHYESLAKAAVMPQSFMPKLTTYFLMITQKARAAYTTVLASAANDKEKKSIYVRFNPIFRQYEMHEAFNHWGFTMRDVFRSKYLQELALDTYNSGLMMYHRKTGMDTWPIIQQFLIPYTNNTHTYSDKIEDRFQWISDTMYRPMMETILSSHVPEQVKHDVVQLDNNTITGIQFNCEHHLELQVKYYALIDVVLKHPLECDVPSNFLTVELREHQMTIVGNFISMKKGYIKTCNDQVYYLQKELELWSEYGGYIPPPPEKKEKKHKKKGQNKKNNKRGRR